MGEMLSYMSMPGIYIRNGTEVSDGDVFYDITDWGGSFIEKARAALLALRERPNGRAIVEAVSAATDMSGRMITIEPAQAFDGQDGPGWSAADLLIRWTPLNHPGTSDDFDQLNGIPPFIILGHELVHALNSLTGKTPVTNNPGNDKAIDEAMTIGLGPWTGRPLSENGLRKEWGLPARTTFCGAPAARLLIGTGY
ncbi:MAG: M91 family zinc metallopeptidase [Alphaproteobacteria bacterium]